MTIYWALAVGIALYYALQRELRTQIIKKEANK